MSLTAKLSHRRGIAVAMVLSLLGAALFSAPPSALAEAEVTIMEIQGKAHLSPLTGDTVTTSGVVTAVGFRSFYVQDTYGDDNPNTSDGILVSSRSSVAVGDKVTVTGVVEENIGGGAATGNLSVTRIVGDATVLSSGNDLPKPIEIGRKGRIAPNVVVISDSELPTNLQSDPAVFNPKVDAIDFYEAMEGMYVEIDRPVTVSATRQFSSFSAEVTVLPSRGNNKIIEPNNARTRRGGIIAQAHPDNTGDQNPERLQIQFDGTIFPAAFPALDVGTKLGDVRGVMGYSFGNYEVNATEEFKIKGRNLKVERTNLKPRKNRVTVAAYNVLNLSPGSSDDAQRAKLADQVVNNLRSPDILALQEIQDDSGTTDDGTTSADQTLQALVDAIAAAGGPRYDFFDVAPADGTGGGVPGGNIRNAFLYNPARVNLLDFASMTDSAFDGTRRPLIATFSFNEQTFTVVNVHLSSRFGSTPIFGGPQPFVQAGEAERGAQTAALNAYVDGVLAVDDDAKVMVVGDFNTMEWTNELTDTLPGDDEVLTNLMTNKALRKSDRKNRYTFIFDGSSQVLDNFFVTDELLESKPKLDIVHANVDYSRLFGDVTASDHDPLVASFKMKLPKNLVKLQVLNVSDLHAQLDPLFVFGQGTFGGAAELATYFERDRQAVKRTLTLTAGDAYGASPPLSGFFDEQPAVRAMRLMGFDADTFGNHNFDQGTTHLQSLVDIANAGSSEPGESFQYVTANLENLEDNITGVEDFKIFNLKGVKVAVIGVTNPDAPELVFPGSFGTIVITDPIAAANKARAEAKAKGAKVFILLAHMGVTGTDSGGAATGPLVDLANGVNGFDLILGDHTGTEFSGVINGATVVENQSRGRTYARVQMIYNKKTKEIVSTNATFVDPVSADVTPDPDITAFLAPLREELNVLLGQVLGSSTVFIPRSDECGQSAGRTCESLVGDVTTDAMRDRYGTDFALTNSGGLRAPLTCPTVDVSGDFCLAGDEGLITAGQVLTVLPFGNNAVTLSVNGAELLSHLEQGVSSMPGVSGRFAQVSGLCFSYDIEAPSGSRVTSAVRQAADGACTGPAIDLTAATAYTLAENDFMSSGGDGYPSDIGSASTREFLDQVVADYVAANTPISPSIGGRITCVDANPGAGDDCPVPVP